MQNLSSVFICFILLITNTVYCQDSSYFQQKVDYEIEVSLDDKQHLLQGNIRITYTNHSPDSLSYIYMHLWPNAYRHQQTPFAKQRLQLDQLDFHFSKKKDRGYIDNLQFAVDGQSVAYKEDITTPDIFKMPLPTPLPPGGQTVITTPFRVKIPGNFSRLAHVDQAYMICQWYPKPAVYDREGWHPMSYLSQGEYYSEFGSFDVKITLPQNYVVGATGKLQTESEKAFIEARAKASEGLDFEALAKQKQDSFPASDTATKTIRYTAENVHDFAWFADKRYYVKKGQTKLASGRKIDTYIYFNKFEANYWKDALDYVDRAVHFYSDIVGEYPYHKVMAVQGIYEGSDMEYPMITVIGKSYYAGGLDNVITHEIGHNWFYGVLGSNERDYPWLDEGWNTYLDARYMSRYYGYGTSTEYLAYLYEALQYDDQPIHSKSQDLSSINYYLCGYAKPTMSFRYLQMYLGTEKLDRLLQQYYQKWKFKHPQPEDLRKLFEEACDKPLDWFFDNLIHSTRHLDYASTKYSCCDKHKNASLTIKNKGDFTAPMPISTLDYKDSLLHTVWVDNLDKGQDTTIQIPDKGQVARVRIDAAEEIPEINRNNNEIRTYGISRKGQKVKVALLADFLEPQKPRVNLLPLVGFNLYDGVMVGGAVYNLPVPRNKWDYVVMPFFSTFALSVAGMAELKHHSYIKKHRFTHGLAFKTFHKRLKRTTEERPYQFAERFIKIKPFLEFEFAKKNDLSKERHKVAMTHSLILEEEGMEQRTMTPADTFWTFGGKEMNWRTTHRLFYTYKNEQAQLPLSVVGMLEYANYEHFFEREHYIKLTVEGKFRFMYQPLWGVDVRIFAGGFLFHTDRDFGAQPLRLIANNRNDYHYDEHIIGRRESENALAHQVSLREGGFKTPIEPVLDDGSSNTFIFSINLQSDIPIKLPFRTKYLKIKPFLDFGYYKNTAPSVTINSAAEELFFSGGIMIDIWDGAGGIYIPLFGSQNLERKVRSFSANNFLRRITFSFNLDRIRPEKVAREIAF